MRVKKNNGSNWLISGAANDVTQATSTSACSPEVSVAENVPTSFSMSPTMIMNYRDMPGSEDEDTMNFNSSLNGALNGSLNGSLSQAVMNLEGHSPPVGTHVFSSNPYSCMPEMQLGNSPQPTVSPADPNLNLGPLGSPHVLNGHVMNSTSSRNSSPIHSSESYPLTKFKQEITN